METRLDDSKWFSGEYRKNEYKLPIYEMRGHDYVLDSVEIGKLEVDSEAQPRKKNADQVSYLVSSIEKKVLMQPLLVRYDKKRDKYLVTEGQHRYYACLQLGFERVPCIIYLDMDKALALLCGIEANAEDRAKSLSGGDMAAKVQTIWDEARKSLKSTFPNEEVTEEAILLHLGYPSRSHQRKFIVSYKVKEILDSHDSLLRGFVADKQDQNTPITTRNLIFFLQRLMQVGPASAEDQALRAEETENILKLTNLFAEAVIIDKWNPDAPDEKAKLAHDHAKNLCRRHPFEALGELCAEILHHAGGAHPSGGAAFCKSSDINWNIVDKSLRDLVNSHVWDEPTVALKRSVNEILRYVTGVVKV